MEVYLMLFNPSIKKQLSNGQCFYEEILVYELRNLYFIEQKNKRLIS